VVRVADFLTRIEQIAAEEPRYQHGHDGSDGYCDCIGLIIGAIRRAGGQWRGLHGSNYAARSEVVSLKKITASSALGVGDVVFKAYEPEQGGYNLPSRYDPGGSDYNGDIRDYYHVGVVVSTYPLRIRHMTSPRPKMDTSLGKWAYHGRLKKIDYSGGHEMGTVTISGGNQDQPVRLRKAASTSSSILAEIPQGSTAELLDDGGTWCKVSWNGLTGYVMGVFVHNGAGPAPDPGNVSVNRAELEKVYDIIGDWRGLRG
jgi:hypothetical protein